MNTSPSRPTSSSSDDADSPWSWLLWAAGSAAVCVVLLVTPLWQAQVAGGSVAHGRYGWLVRLIEHAGKLPTAGFFGGCALLFVVICLLELRPTPEPAERPTGA